MLIYKKALREFITLQSLKEIPAFGRNY